MTKSKLSLPLALLLAAAVSASPALAQGKGNGKGNGNGNGNGRGQKVEQRDDRRDRDDEVRLERRRDDDGRWERRSGSRTSGNLRRSSTWGGSRWELSSDRRTLSRNGRRVPPGWCIGRGNPHNTPANCGGWRYNQSRSIWDWIGIGSRDGRTTRDVWSDGRTTRRTSGSGIYSMSHSEYHRWHDAQCRERTERVSGDARTRLARVLEIRAQCNREHDEWHRRTGISR